MGNLFRKKRVSHAEISQSSEEVVAREERLKLLFLGAGESGKTTLFKQMSINYSQNFSEESLKAHTKDVILGLMNSFHEFLVAIGRKYETVTDDDELKKQLELSFPADATKMELHLTPEKAEIMKRVWTSDKGRDIWNNRNKNGVTESLSYFCEHIDRIAEVDYEPTVKDYLLCRIRTTGWNNQTFVHKGVTLYVIDVGGQKSERKKWAKFFDGVNAVLYVASLSDFDQQLFEDTSVPRFEDAIQQFQKIAKSAIFKDTPMILFLNKEDLLKAKVRKLVEDKVNLDDVFPGIGLGTNYNDCVIHIREYIKGRFLDGLERERIENIYTYYITAIDTDIFRQVFSAMTQVILTDNIREHFNSNAIP